METVHLRLALSFIAGFQSTFVKMYLNVAPPKVLYGTEYRTLSVGNLSNNSPYLHGKPCGTNLA